MTKQELYAVIEQHVHVTDEWGGEKLANWRYGRNLCVAGIDDAVNAILSALQPTRYIIEIYRRDVWMPFIYPSPDTLETGREELDHFRREHPDEKYRLVERTTTDRVIEEEDEQ